MFKLTSCAVDFRLLVRQFFLGLNNLLVCSFSSSRELLHMFELTSVGKVFVCSSNLHFFKVTEKLRNFTLSQGKLILWRKVRENGNILIRLILNTIEG